MTIIYFFRIIWNVATNRDNRQLLLLLLHTEYRGKILLQQIYCVQAKCCSTGSIQILFKIGQGWFIDDKVKKIWKYISYRKAHCNEKRGKVQNVASAIWKKEQWQCCNSRKKIPVATLNAANGQDRCATVATEFLEYVVIVTGRQNPPGHR